MRLCYQVATPDVAIADSVTAYQGPLEKSFSDLAKLGYKGVELMTLNPSELDWDFVKSEAEKNGLKVVLVCTGEIWGQLGLSYTSPKAEVRAEAIRRSKEIIDFAATSGCKYQHRTCKRTVLCRAYERADGRVCGKSVPGAGRLCGTEECEDCTGDCYDHADEFH